MLTNPRAERVRSVRVLAQQSARARAGRFLAEGPQAVREAVRYAADAVVDIYATPAAGSRHGEILATAVASGIHVHEVSEAVLAAMVDTGAPQGILAVCRVPRPSLEAVLAARPRVLVLLTNVRDPGNAGTVIRGADASGADAVLVSESSVDVFGPKVVRSTAGSLWHLPVVTGLPVIETLASLRAHGIRTLAADGAGTTLLPEVPLDTPHAWVMGNEAWGIETGVRSRCDEVVRVPIYGRAESLNLAMAATVCLYASAGTTRRLVPGG